MAKVQVVINRDSIHHRVNVPITDASSLPTGQTKEVLYVSFRCPEYPKLPTYGIELDMPVPLSQVKAVVKEKVQEIKAQMGRDESVRTLLGAGILEFTVEV